MITAPRPSPPWYFENGRESGASASSQGVIEQVFDSGGSIVERSVHGGAGGGVSGEREPDRDARTYRGTLLGRNSPPLGAPQDPRYSPTVGSWEGGVSYGRGIPVAVNGHPLREHFHLPLRTVTQKLGMCTTKCECTGVPHFKDIHGHVN